MAMNAPTRINAKVHGSRQSIPGGAPRLVGGWDEADYGGTTEYIRADVLSGLLEALKEARVQVEILQERLGIKDTGYGTLSIIDAALAKAEGRS